MAANGASTALVSAANHTAKGLISPLGRETRQGRLLIAGLSGDHQCTPSLHPWNLELWSSGRALKDVERQQGGHHHQPSPVTAMGIASPQRDNSRRTRVSLQPARKPEEGHMNPFVQILPARHSFALSFGSGGEKMLHVL